MIRTSTVIKAFVPTLAALSLAACGNGETDRSYETDVTDQSGGELIVTEQTPAVPVTVPDTPMTPVPVETPTNATAATPTTTATPADAAPAQ